MSITKIKNYTQFVNENLNGGFSKKERVFEAEEKKPSEMEIRKAIFDTVAYPTTKEDYSKLLATMTGKDIIGSGNAFNLIRDFIVGLSNEAVEYTQAITGQEENIKKGLLVINIRPKNVDNTKEVTSKLYGKMMINTTNEDLKNIKSIFEVPVEVMGNQYKESNVELTNALLLPSIISTEGKTYVSSTTGNPVNYGDFVKNSVQLNKGDKKEQSLVASFFDKKGEVIKRVNNVESKHKSASELLTSVPTEQKMKVLDSYSSTVKNVLSDGIATFKSKESKEVPTNVAPQKGGKVLPDNQSLKYTKNYPSLNEAKSCKPKVTKFLKDNECEGINYITGTCKVGTKTMKIEKALIKLEAPASLIKSYSEECSKEVNEALRLMRRR